MVTAKDTYIRSFTLVGLPEYIDSTGIDCLALQKSLGLPTADWDDPSLLVPFRAACVLLETVSRRLDRPFFALEWVLAMPRSLPALQPYFVLAKFEKTIGGWLKSVQRYVRLHSNAVELDLFEDHAAQTGTLRYTSDRLTNVSRQNSELVIAAIVLAARSIAGQPNRSPNLIRFQHSRGLGNSDAYDKCYGCALEFDCEHTEIVFPLEILDIPTHGGLSFLKSLAGAYLRRKIASMPEFRSNYRDMVRLIVESLVSSQHCNIGEVAELMDTNVKQLQRSLAEDGTSFSEIVENVKHSRAIELLSKTAIPVGRIANMLDYGGAAQFTLAFRRWTGQSPLEYRKRNLSIASAVE
jgi:AraC-like DNA-binding protein